MADDENQVHQGGVDQDHELALQLQAELNASARAPARTIRLMVKPGAGAGAGAGRPPELPNGPVSQRPSRAASMSQGMNYYDDRSQSNYTSRAATASGGEDSRDDEEDEFMNTDDEEEAHELHARLSQGPPEASGGGLGCRSGVVRNGGLQGRA